MSVLSPLDRFWAEGVIRSPSSADHSVMRSLMERYVAGEHEAVWHDLAALGIAVREETYAADAIAVAEETMKRARHNSELIVTRLEKLGYQFYTQRNVHAELMQLISKAAVLTADLSSAELSLLGVADPPLPGSPIRWPLTATNALPQLPDPNSAIARLGAGITGKNTTAAEMLDSFQPYMQLSASLAESAADSQLKPSPTVAADIAEYETRIGGRIPLSLAAWCKIVGPLSLVGEHPTLSFRVPNWTPDLAVVGTDDPAIVVKNRPAPFQIPPLSDPLEINCLRFHDDKQYDEELEDGYGTPGFRSSRAGLPRNLMLADNDRGKAGLAGSTESYSMTVPDASADAIFGDWHRTTFVDYLRISFRWGGFPGWERYSNCPNEVAYLREGLLDL